MSIIDDLEKWPTDLKYEVTFRALGEAVKAITLIAVRLSDLLDRMENLLDRAEAQAWTEAIREQLKQRKRGHNGKSNLRNIRK